MHPVDFITELASKFAPIDASNKKTLQLQLTELFNDTLLKIKRKMDTNIKLDEEALNLERQQEEAMNNGDANSANDIAFKMAKLNAERPKLTLFERSIDFLSKPLVRLVLMLLFGFVASWIAKKLLNRNKVEEDEPQDEPQYNYGAPPAYPYYPQGVYPQHQWNGQQNRNR